MSGTPLEIGNEWKTTVAPIVAKLRLSATLGMDTTFDSAGSAALAKILEELAWKLDIGVAVINAMEEDQ